ncbi:hypothetical protein L6164_002196 [Bauhinia variegata]|uniref:Uncharacterized protein n=1 Tax=Bauhinia variegata TaxID=167791 RepID=A0ACB9PXG7_BAUVA|nr:hypothetical protein L6164_002196 [Bauhinia variegata]
MGQKIVEEESPSEPGGRSRLWFYEDIIHVLEENTGTDKIQFILLDRAKHELIYLIDLFLLLFLSEVRAVTGD